MPALVEREVGVSGFDDGRAAQIADAQDDRVALRGRDRDRPFGENTTPIVLLLTQADADGRSL